jgi:aspartyl-tRNA(Asn)/glutamyl-tRNA(Gln) amidotransferase subunit B
MEQAIEFEAKRQIELLEDGGTIVQETRLYDPDRNETRSMRTKEEAHDYRYFPDPDLLPLVLTQNDIDRMKATLPELPAATRERFQRQYALSEYDAGLLTASRSAADYFEQLVRASGVEPKTCANWQNGMLARSLKQHELDLSQSPIPAAKLAQILQRLADGTLSNKTAQKLFDVAWSMGADFPIDELIEREGLKQVSDAGALEKAVDEVLAANAKQVADYKAGKEKAFNSLVGQVMKATKGKANPAQVNEILRRKLGG